MLTRLRIGISYWLVCLALAPLLQGAGLVVFRADNEFQFADIISLTVNDKDKVLSLGPSPKLTGPANKLNSVKLGGTMLIDADAGVVAVYERGSATYILPDNAPKGAPTDPAGLWKSAKLAYKKSQTDKKPYDLDGPAFVAFLPDGVDGLAHLCTDLEAAKRIGGAAKALATQFALISAAVKQYGSNPALAPVEKYVLQSMRERHDRFESGSGGYQEMEQALRFAELSASAYPSAPGHAELRNALAARRKWLERKSAILRSLNAAGEWDAYVLGANEFERYHGAFPEMAALYTAALRQSLQLHKQAGDERLQDGENRAAYREFQLAARRQPSDPAIQQKVQVAWTDYSRALAIDNQRSRKQLTAGQREAIDQQLAFAARFKQEGRHDRAIEEIRKAEMIDAQSIPVLLLKAEVLAAMRDYGKALATLEEYDRHAIEDERKKSSQLRTTLLFERNSIMEKLNAEFQKAWAAGSMHQAREKARQILVVKDDDPEGLFSAGVSSFVTRDRKSSEAFFARYLEVSNNLDGNPERRAHVRRLMAPAAAPVGVAETGDVNWLSGQKLPKGVFYDPASLGFQPHIERIEANKLRVGYEWDGERLKSITPAFEKPADSTGEKKIFFGYHPQRPQVVIASQDPNARVSADPDERFHSANQILPTFPDIDPAALQALTGTAATVGIAGNRYFHPFAWDKVHYFRFTYDAQGRVAQARELDAKGAPIDHLVEFDWNGQKLVVVRGYQGPDAQRVKNYERVLSYINGRLMSEEIRAQGKTTKITYKYNANRLVSAECDRDVTLDDRSRQVAFAAAHPTVQVQ